MYSDDGSRVSPAASEDLTAKVGTIRAVFGWVLIALGIVPIILHANAFEQAEYLAELYRDASISAVIVLSGLSNFVSMWNRLFYLPASVLSVIAGVLLLKNREDAPKLVKVNLICHIISLCYTVTIWVLAYCAPEWVLRDQLPEKQLLLEGIAYWRGVANPLRYYFEYALIKVISACVVIVGTVCLRKASTPEDEKKKLSPEVCGLIILTAFLTIIGYVEFFMRQDLALLGTDLFAQVIQTKNIVLSLIGDPATVAVIVMMAIGLLTRNMKTGKLVLLVMLVTAVCGVAGYFALLDSVDAWLIDGVTGDAVVYYICAALLLAAVFFWIIVTTRGSISFPQQILLIILLFIVYIAVEKIKYSGITSDPSTPQGCVGMCITITLFCGIHLIKNAKREPKSE